MMNKLSPVTKNNGHIQLSNYTTVESKSGQNKYLFVMFKLFRGS